MTSLQEDSSLYRTGRAVHLGGQVQGAPLLAVLPSRTGSMSGEGGQWPGQLGTSGHLRREAAMSLCPRCAARCRAVWPSLGRAV